VPPIKSHILGSSNKSDAEYQIRSDYYPAIVSDVKDIMDEINEKLLPSLGFSDLIIHYHLSDTQSQKDILDVAQRLGSIGANPKKLNKWLIDNGLDIPSDLLEEQDFVTNPTLQKSDEQIAEKNGNPKLKDNTKLNKNSDLFPSRRKKEMDMSGGSRVK